MRSVIDFGRSQNGNITIMFAFMLVIVLLFTGGAVDFTRRNAVRADLIESLDAAGLAMAQLDESNPPEMQSMTSAEKIEYLKAYGRQFFHENFAHENEIKNFTLDFLVDAQKITPVATGEIKTLFLGVASDLMGNQTSFNTLSMAASTEITRRGSGPIELAMVLDVTGSMASSINGTPKIDSLKTAVDSLLDTLYGDDPNATSEYVTTSIVPFAAYVNAGGATFGDGTSAWNSAWNDHAAAATYHGAHFLHVDDTGTIDLDTKVNHFNLFNSISGVSWTGCNEERPYPLDEIDVAAGTAATNGEINTYNTPPPGTTNSTTLAAFSSAPALKLSVSTLSTVGNSRFVPNFVPEDPDCGSTACYYKKSNGSTSGSYQLYNAGGINYYGHFFKDPDSDGVSESSYNNSFVNDYRYTRSTGSSLDKYLKVVDYARRVWRNYTGESNGTGSTQCYTGGGNIADSAFHTWLTDRGATECGNGDEYILRQAYVGWFNPATSTYVGKLDLPNSISSSKGPNDNCPTPIFYSSQDKKKVHDFVQSLSPGGNTNSAEGMMWGWRVLSPGAPFESSIAYNDGKWQKAVVLMTDGFNTVSSRNTHWYTELSPYGFGREERMGVGINTASEMRDEIDNKLLRICARMKEKGILVYAVTFGLSDSVQSESDTKKIFQACATKTTAPYYFDAPDGEELKDAFNDIAQDLVQLHVSK